MTVIIGIDPHKSSHTATAIKPDLVEVGTIRVRASRTTVDQLLKWATGWTERRWAIEGARGLGQLLAQQLVAAGELVVDVPATLSSRVRSLDTGHGRKTDRIDAGAVAVVAAQRPDLPPVTADDHTRVLRLLADRRDELVAERRRTINRLHRALSDTGIRMLITIHDELIFEVPYSSKSAITKHVKLIVDQMERCDKIKHVPLRTELKWSPKNWSDADSLSCKGCTGHGLVYDLSEEEMFSDLAKRDWTRLRKLEGQKCKECDGRGYRLGEVYRQLQLQAA